MGDGLGAGFHFSMIWEDHKVSGQDSGQLWFKTLPVWHMWIYARSPKCTVPLYLIFHPDADSLVGREQHLTDLWTSAAQVLHWHMVGIDSAHIYWILKVQTMELSED